MPVLGGVAAGARWFAYAVALAALFGAWALASPPYSVPDEPAHTVKAAAVARGQLYGEQVRHESGKLVWRVRVPSAFADAYPWTDCYRGRSDATADCAPDAPSHGDDPQWTGTPALGYPPLFYALVGAPSRLSSGLGALYAMRLVSAAACAVAVTAGLWSLARVTGARVAMAGGLLVVSPMVAFLAGSVNPNGFENAAAVAAWGGLAAVAAAVADDRPADRRVVIVAAVGCAGLALTRWLSPVFVLAAVGAAGLSAPLRTWVDARGRRDLRWLGGAILVALAVAGALIAMSPVRDVGPGPMVPDGDGRLEALVGQTGYYLRNMVGQFGWLDTSSPMLTLLGWAVALGALGAVALLVADAASNRAAVVVVLASFALPIVAQWPTIGHDGMPWQGRYTLPLAVGAPILALAGIGRARSRRPERLVGSWRTIGVTGVALLGAGHLAAVAWALRRYAVGVHGPLTFWDDALWSPPGGHVAVLSAATLAVTTLAACCLAPGVHTAMTEPSDT